MSKKKKDERELQINPPSSSRRWIFALITLFLSIVWAISLFTYSEYDWPEVDSSITNSNAFGRVGSVLAYITIYSTFGYLPSFLLPILLFFHGIMLFRRNKKIPYFKVHLPIIIYAWLFGCWISVYQVLFLNSLNKFQSGFLSSSTIGFLINWLNPTGTILALTFTTLLVSGLVFSKFFYRVYLWIKKKSLEHQVEKPTQRFDENPTQNGSELLIPSKHLSPEVSFQVGKSKNEEESEIKRVDITSYSDKHNTPQIVPPSPIQTVKENIPNPIAQDIEYKLPSLEIFEKGDTTTPNEPFEEIAEKLQKTLKDFNVHAQISKIHPGPIVTRYDFIPGPGVKVSSFTSLSDDLARAMRAVSVRVLAPIPGSDAVGIEIPNQNPRIVRIREVFESVAFQKENLVLPVALGLSTDGQPRVTDLTRLPHLLIAGATGSGKSVFINALLASLLLKKTPQEVRIALIDPKQVELTPYRVLTKHHLIQMAGAEPVVNKPTEAVKFLQACAIEMERRLELLTNAGVRDIKEYQYKFREGNVNAKEPLSYIVVVIDELADLMLTSAKEVEDPIQRIAQKARAVGIHLVVATQRPSVNVITGIIKANLTTRLAFQVASQVDSRTIIEQSGAEKLLGKGDALFTLPGAQKPERIHCGLIEGKETESLLKWIIQQPQSISIELKPPKESFKDTNDDMESNSEFDTLFVEAARMLVRQQQGSIALIQRRFKVGHSRAGRILDQLERNGIVGPFEGSKSREVLIKDMETLEELLSKLGLHD
ncbi:MAG: DNA translocase FtsK [bacterium]|nr:DNA translocase FtsK [bacterium]